MSANAAPLGTILVADDNPSAREMLEIMLRTHGYRVFTAADGPHALQVLEQEPIDLALVDVIMPGEPPRDAPHSRRADYRAWARGRPHRGN